MPNDDSLLNDPILASVPVVEGYKTLGAVVLYRKIGEGGMGTVYKGRHLRLKIDVAVKVLSPTFTADATRAREFVDRLNREARTAAQIIHQNLVHVSDVNSLNGLYYLVMEYIEGETAIERLYRVNRFSELEATLVVLETAQGLAAAHSRGFVHRDVKPENILIDRQGNVKLADLGLAKAVNAGPVSGMGRELNLTGTNQVIGTPMYMSPEQTRAGEEITPASDVWSLGVTYFQLLTGRVPFFSRDLFDVINLIRDAEIPNLREIAPEVSPGAETIIRRALEKNPKDRYPDCRIMAKVLRKHLDRQFPDLGDSPLELLAGDFPSEEMQGRDTQAPPGEVISKIGLTLMGERIEGDAVQSPTTFVQLPTMILDDEEDREKKQQRMELLKNLTVDTVIERRMEVQDLRQKYEPGDWNKEILILQNIDKDIRVALEAEHVDLGAALFRLDRANNALLALQLRKKIVEDRVVWQFLSMNDEEGHREAQALMEVADEQILSSQTDQARQTYEKLDAFLFEAIKRMIEG